MRVWVTPPTSENKMGGGGGVVLLGLIFWNAELNKPTYLRNEKFFMFLIDDKSSIIKGNTSEDVKG